MRDEYMREWGNGVFGIGGVRGGLGMVETMATRTSLTQTAYTGNAPSMRRSWDLYFCTTFIMIPTSEPALSTFKRKGSSSTRK
jgi:hypothetical protein